jgi:hypothetical protein
MSEKTVSENIRHMANWFDDDDQWAEIKKLLDKQPTFRHGIADFLRSYADSVERAFVALGGKSDMMRLWDKMVEERNANRL